MADPKPASKPLHPLAQKALARLITICQGNGINSKQIRVAEAAVQDVAFTAGTFFDLAPTSVERVMAGRQQVGELLHGPQDIERVVRDLGEKSARNRGLEESLRQQLLSRKDKGFMLVGAVLPVTGMEREVSWHEPCTSCDHTGHVRCDQCHGQKFARCQQCHGQTMMQCPLCRGTGHLQGQRGMQPCNKCNGMRRVPCTMCMRTGKIPCKKCRATGQMTCPTCKGQAYSTRVVKIGLKAQTRADYARAQVPEHMTFLIENEGPKLVADGDITVAAHPLTDEGKMGVHYEAGFPFADITFAIGKMPLKVEAYGTGKFVRLPAILDQLLVPPLEILNRAARGEGDVAGLLHDAGRYRAIAFTLVTTIRANAAQTTQRLMEKYPQGLSREMAAKIGKAADTAVARITQKPRYTGLFIGLALVAAFYAAYYVGPLRDLIAPYVATPMLRGLVDLMVMLTGGAITTLSIQLTARGALHKALGHLIPARKRRNFLPRTHGAGWWGFAGGLILYLLTIEATRHLASAATPYWYTSFLTALGIV